MRYIPRTMEATLGRAVRTFPAVVVTGPRQSGKTTLLKHGWGKTHRFVSLENPVTRDYALHDPVGFFKDNPPPLILDEIQYVPQLLSFIKEFIDGKRTPGQWLMTGSQGFSVMKNVSQSLAGRVAVLSLTPFSARELSGGPEQAVPLGKWLEGIFHGTGGGPAGQKEGLSLGRWLLRGGYPEPALNTKTDLALWCSSYIQTYLERDLRSILNVGELSAFGGFLKLCAARTGQVLNLSDLARDSGISVPTAKNWISALEASYILFTLPPYFKNFGKRVIKAPKLYFWDTALAAFLMGIESTEGVLKGPAAGPLFETAVVAAFRKAFLNRGESSRLYYWRSREGLEVDLVIEQEARLYPVEIKSSSTINAHQASGLAKWMKLEGSSAGQGLIVANVEKPTGVVPGIRAVPWDWI